MAFPKVLLCHLGTVSHAAHEIATEEAALRSVGFAVAALGWAELDAQPRGWMQWADVLREPGLTAWIVAGAAADFSAEILSCMSMLSLALPQPLLTVCLLRDGGALPPLPPPLAHAHCVRGAGWAAKVMALRHKTARPAQLPLHLRTHISPLTGLWLELGPPAGEVWQGFMAGVTGAETAALGVGPRGQVPLRCTLHYPQNGILGELDGQPFHACAAHNMVDEHTACYVRVDGCARTLFVTRLPEAFRDDATAEGANTEATQDTRTLLCVDFV